MARLSKLSRSVTGRVALITGAASGMGNATAKLFADEGAHVALVDRDAAGLAAVEKDIAAAGHEVLARALDVTDTPALEAFVEDVVGHFGRLDIVVNNAGIAGGGPIDSDAYVAGWQKVMAVNLESHMHLVRAALPHLRASDAGRVINIASTEGLGASRMTSPYTAAKHGVVGFTKGMAVELGREGITCNAICPGPIATRMTAPIPDAAKEKFARRRVPLQRYADPEEVAHMTLNLALPASSFVNGAVVPVDGGLAIKFD